MNEIPDLPELDGLPPIMRVRDVAEFVGVHPATIRREMNRGHLEYRKIGGSVRILRSSVAAWLAGHGNA